MSQGKGSVCRAMIMVVAQLCLLLHPALIHASTYAVGDSRGWNFGVENWPNGTTFYVGDVLEFNYDPKIHNVAQVDINGYNSCVAPDGSPVYHNGDDDFKLVKGVQSFICTVGNHCLHGMKVSVTAI